MNNVFDYKNKLADALRYNDLQGESLYEIYKRNKAEKEYADRIAAENNIANNGIDHYFHRKTVYEATQQNPLLGSLMMDAGYIKEIFDKNKYTKKYGEEYAEREQKKDLQNNKLGFILGLNSKLKAEDNPEFNSYNSDSMNLLLKILKETK